MGVWIEIRKRICFGVVRPCHTLYGCVDWNTYVLNPATRIPVTPFMGVWIEITHSLPFSELKSGHTLYGCVDWNRFWNRRDFRKNTSHPLWVCGLKSSCLSTSAIFLLVTPFMGVWIEIKSIVYSENAGKVTPFMGVWIEIVNEHSDSSLKLCHTLYGCVDWNDTTAGSTYLSTSSHPLWVCGLKWKLPEPEGKNEFVTPFMGVWIEMRQLKALLQRDSSHPLWVCGLKWYYGLSEQ